MQNSNQDSKYILDLIKQSKSIAIIPSKSNVVDAFCSAAGLYYSLKEYIEKETRDSLVKKDLYFIFDQDIPGNCKECVDAHDVTSDIVHRELLVSVDYSGTSAERARPYTENNTFYLKISPVTKDFDKSKIKADIVGFNFDIVFSIGMQHMDELVYMYHDLDSELRAASIINIDNNNLNSRFGLINVVDTTASSLSHLMLKKTSEWGMYAEKRSAAALLRGISAQG